MSKMSFEHIGVMGTINGRDISADGTKLDSIAEGADATNSTNVTAAIDGADLSSATVAADDKILIKDTDDSNSLKTVTAQSIADLGGGGGDQLRSVMCPGGDPAGDNTYWFETMAEGNSTLNLTADRIDFVLFVCQQPITFTRIGMNVTTGTASKICRLGIYEVAADGSPGDLVLDAGTIDCSTTGEKEIAISQELNGLYYLCYISNGVSGVTTVRHNADTPYNFGTASGTSTIDTMSLYATSQTGVVSGGLDSTAPSSLSRDTTNFPAGIWLRVV